MAHPDVTVAPAFNHCRELSSKLVSSSLMSVRQPAREPMSLLFSLPAVTSSRPFCCILLCFPQKSQYVYKISVKCIQTSVFFLFLWIKCTDVNGICRYRCCAQIVSGFFKQTVQVQLYSLWQLLYSLIGYTVLCYLPSVLNNDTQKFLSAFHSSIDLQYNIDGLIVA